MNSPYIKNENRLADVIAAIQVMSTYKFYKLDFATWADRIVGDRSKSKHWEKVFSDHPEFFRLDQTRTKASLVWRRNYPKNYNVDRFETIPKDEYLKLSDEDKKTIGDWAKAEQQRLVNASAKNQSVR